MWILVGMLSLLLLGIGLLVLARATRRANDEKLAERVGEAHGDAANDSLSGYQRLANIRNPLLRELCRRLWSAGIEAGPARIAQFAFLWVAAVVLATLVLGLIGIVLMCALLVLAALVVAQRKRSRRRQINAQMPNFLGYLVRALTAGNTLEEGINNAALESVDPIRGVFLSVSRQVRLGASIEDTLAETARIHELKALHILAMSARVNRRFGGSMRRVIASLVDTIRQQEAAARELKALTGETRFSAYVVAAIPVAISLFFYLQNPQYYAAMLSSSGGRIAVMLALMLEALGLFIIWRMMARLQEPDA
ncbi:type II secretion system F family protein [Salinisphaera sp.]|uniref:type II secretion system F family protein n=1 Tax=Salinisphaera sp. TaxID=1914330 RepID=UPI000C4A2E60|nr:type II secretion system F family protein [Salinisphaera sp.]MAS10720.1 hypothetical protein [Salinisphaera sp.]